ncbi:hypothetical protein N566_04680, partial [Streptomycetaceae bacterium MP113-05]
MTGSRETVLARIRAALADVPASESPAGHPVGRDYLSTHTAEDPAALLDLLAANLADYRAQVHRTTKGRLPGVLTRLL